MVKWLLLTVGIVISLRTPFTSASNILIWSPTFGHSHVAFLGNIADVLTADGHNVTILTLTLDPNVTTFGNRLPAHTIRIESEENNWLQMDVKGPSLWNTPPCTGLCTRTSDLLIIAEQSYRICKALLDDDETMKKLLASKFDLVFSETLENCGPGIFQVLNIPSVVMVSALGMMPKMLEVSGLRATPSFVPLCLTPYSDEMTFFERFINFNLQMIFSTYKYKVEDQYWQLLNDRYPGFPSIESISMNKTALMMTNVHEFAESPRPTTNMIRYVGGMTIYPPKALRAQRST
ncbi:unnamed protein product [Heligmosomoides polygyrus]|uniref:glucuronosyltransferase n=1 Tax=Heligmosomoides polygyrus TaxID=6339 RepID=A0A3P7XXC7_HELPZ|nr:unnamed protein product [Heligmosomoides polygyrus]